MRNVLREAAAAGLHWSGALRLVQSLSRRVEITSSGRGHTFQKPRYPKHVIVCHHRIGSGGVPYYSNFPAKDFEEQILFLRRNYRLLSMDQVCRELDEGVGPSQAVAITFDDGYRDLYTHAFPVLRRYGIPAMIYLTASAIESGEISWYDRIFLLTMSSERSTIEIGGTIPRRFSLTSRGSRIFAATEIVKRLRGCSNEARIEVCSAMERNANFRGDELKNSMLTWAQIREMQEAGISFGAHTMSHPAVSRLTAGERQHELGESKRMLEEKLQTPVDHFAYPFGSVSDIDVQSCDLIARLGYRSAVSTVWGVNTPATDRYLLRRMGGELPSLYQFAFHLRWLFLNEPQPPPELQVLEKAAGILRKPAANGATNEKRSLSTEVQRA